MNKQEWADTLQHALDPYPDLDAMPRDTDQSGDTSPSVLQAIQAERDCAADLYQAACTLMRYKLDAASWINLENAAARWNAAMQFARNTELRKDKPSA